MALKSIEDLPHLINQFDWAEKDSEKYKGITRFNKNLWSEADEIHEAVDYFLEEYKKDRPIRYSTDKIKYVNTLKVIIVNIISTHFSSKKYITISLGNSSFNVPDIYEPIRITRTIFKNLIDWMVEKDYIHLYKAPRGRYSKMTSVFEPLPILRDDIATFSIKYKDIMYHPHTVTTKLKDENGALISFKETEETRYRHKVLQQYSKLLNDSSISINGEEINRLLHMESKYNRELGLGGRIYGAREWQNASSEDRKTITINGKPTIEVDIKNCTINMAMHLNRHTHPSWIDMYLVNGYSREFVKKVANIMFNISAVSVNQGCSKTTNTVLESNISKEDGTPYTREEIREGVDFIYDYYRITSIDNWLFKGRGLELQHYDSMVCIRVIEEFVKLDKVVLTIHDSFIVDTDDKELLVDTLVKCYHEVIGYEPILNI